MTDPYVGEIRIFAGNFAPVGWQPCDGRLLDIADFPALYTLIGTTYGGDGQTNFAVPDLRSRAPIHQGNGFVIAEAGGAEAVTLTTSQLPIHTHPYVASTTTASIASPSGNLNAESSQINMYIADDPSASLAPSAITPVGGSQPHDNMQPFLVLMFIIATGGTPP